MIELLAYCLISRPSIDDMVGGAGEVGHVAFIVDHHVLQLEIAMDDAL